MSKVNKALILVGGFGTRLRPLTLSCPKPLVDFANKPIVAHQIEALVKVGVTEIVLAISYKPDAMLEYIKKVEEQFKIKVTCSQEIEPMGTAGPLKLAEQHLTKDNDSGMFFVFNSDVICEFPLTKMIEFHKNHKKEGTILLTQVEDPSKYGVVVYEDDGKIKRFVEKPKEFISNKINAGLYLFNTDIIKRIEPRPTSIEREIFPKMAEDQNLYSMVMDGFWMDIGQPKDFLIGTRLYLESLKKANSNLLSTSENILGNVIIDPSAKVHKDAVIGPNVSIGPNCVIEEGVRLKNCCVMTGSTVKAHSWVSDTIIGWQSVVGKWVRIEGVTVLAEDVVIKDELYINGASILPHKAVSNSVPDKGTILM